MRIKKKLYWYSNRMAFIRQTFKFTNKMTNTIVSTEKRTAGISMDELADMFEKLYITNPELKNVHKGKLKIKKKKIHPLLKKYLEVDESNHTKGGRKGREEGKKFEENIVMLLKEYGLGFIQSIKETEDIEDYDILLVDDLVSKKWSSTLSKIQKPWLLEYMQQQRPAKDNKRAADILVIYKTTTSVQKIGIDTKKSESQGAQWLAKTFNTKVEDYLCMTEEDKRHLNIYVEYNTQKQRTFTEQHVEFESVKNTIDSLIQRLKKELIERFDDNSLYYNDYVLTSDNEDHRKLYYINIHTILNEILTTNNIVFKNSNFSYGDSIAFKPHGSSKNKNMQIFLRSDIFKKSEFVESYICIQK